MLLTTALGRCIRFPVDDVRVFAGRDSTGVRGIRLAEGDSVISMAILRAVDATPDERAAYLKHANAMRAAASGDGEDDDDRRPPPDEEERGAPATRSASRLERIAELGAAEQFILTVSVRGLRQAHLGLRLPPHRPRRAGPDRPRPDQARRPSGRLLPGGGDADEILLVTDQGQLIRVHGRSQVRIDRPQHPGVIIFRTADNEHVVSVERIEGEGGGEDDAENGDDAASEDGASEDGGRPTEA